MDLNKKTFFILTGASKGIGKTLAVECCRKFKPNSVAVLIARSEKGLQETRQDILDLKNDITVKTYSLDLSAASAKEYAETMSDALTGLNVNDFERAFIVHNVGSLGDVTKTANELSDIAKWQKYFHLNMFGVCALNVEFMKIFKPVSKLVVNITSKCSVVPFASMGEYCCGKAAREMYFAVLAVENKDIVVLNYSPGPVNTDMTVVLQNDSADDGIREMFRKSRENNSILATETTAARFLVILEEFKFKSGDRVDFYDEL